MRRDYQYYKDAIAGRALPAALIDMEALEDNARRMLDMADGKPIRLVSKSIRCPAILRHLLDFDDRFQGIMCYNPDEAVFLSQQGFSDLLVAYPSAVQHSIENVCKALQKGADITLMVDSPAHVEQIAGIAAQHEVTASLCLDVDMSTQHGPIFFGVKRSPVRSVAAALEVYKTSEQYDHVTLNAVMGYEAQIAGVMDNVPGQFLKSQLMSTLKKRSIPLLQERRQAVVAALTDNGAELRLVNGGGSFSIESTRADSSVSEIAAGSAMYAPHIFDNYQCFKMMPAALFALPVCRQPESAIVTCNGGGYIASGAAGKDRLPQVYLPGQSSLLAMEGAGEVQTPIRLGQHQLNGGEPVFMRHAKAGELCERFNTLLLVRDGEITDEVQTYRGLGECYV